MTLRSTWPAAQHLVRLALCAAVLLCQPGCKKSAPAADEKPAVAVEAAHPTVGPITETIEADGVLAPVAQAAIQAKITAPIKRFYVQRGSPVRAGQLLATLENGDLAAAALDNKGAYTAAEGAYATATQSAVPQEETQARLDVEQTKATLALDQSILSARENLLAQGAIPGRDVDTARSTYQQAKAAYDIAQGKYDALRKSGRRASLESATGQLESARGKYLGAEAQLRYTEIRTPIRGIVTDRPLFAGETAAQGSAVITVMDTAALIAKIHIAQRQAQQLAIGGEASLIVSGIDRPVAAKVSLVSPALDAGSTTVEVWLRAENPGGTLRPGTAVRASIQGRTIPRAILIPAEAVQRSSEGAGKVVMVVSADGTAHKRPVTLGVETAETAQVLDGVGPGDTVITAGAYGLDDGSTVTLEPAKQKKTPGAAE